MSAIRTAADRSAARITRTTTSQSDQTGPAATVVVATHNRADLLPRLRDALEAQRDVPSFEVVVVDDGSTDSTPQTLAELTRTTTVPLRALRLERNRGPAAARNAGWRAAQAPVIAFTDDDCVPQPGWLSALLRGFEAADIVQGRTFANPTQPAAGWFAWAPETAEATGFYETCNIAYRRTVLEAVDGFDESIGGHRRVGRPGRYVAPAWGEDTDLALRARRAGAISTFADEAVVWHDVKPGGLVDRLRDLPRRGSVVGVVKQHPDLRAAFHSRWFAQRAHGYVLLTLLAAGLVARRPFRLRSWLLSLVLGAPWVAERGSYYPRRLWPRVLPQWWLVDLADLGVMAAASARERTLFL